MPFDPSQSITRSGQKRQEDALVFALAREHRDGPNQVHPTEPLCRRLLQEPEMPESELADSGRLAPRKSARNARRV